MAIRQAPAKSASDFPPGTRRRGLDGNMWQVVMVKGGRQRWMKVSSAKKHVNRKSLKIRVTRTKGIRTRKGPAVSATSLRPGTIRRGLDGNMWKIIVASNGVPRWQLVR